MACETVKDCSSLSSDDQIVAHLTYSLNVYLGIFIEEVDIASTSRYSKIE